MKLSEAVGKRVENLLAERNMTQYQLYKNGGIPRSTISVTVDGKYKTVKLDTIYQIVATLGITLKEFFDDELFDELEEILVMGDVGANTASRICAQLRDEVKKQGITDPLAIRSLIKDIVADMLAGGQELNLNTKPAALCGILRYL